MVEYAKKKEKKAKITFQKDEAIPRDDVYKSHTVRVASGEPASSVSRPIPKRKPGTVRPITSGKLLKKGGPSSSSSAARPKPKPKPAVTPAAKPVQTKSAVQHSAASVPPPPPRPVPSPKTPSNPMYRAKFAFEGQEGEMTLQKDDVVELVRKDDDGGAGWWLVKKDGVEGWAPYNYLELVPAAKSTPPPPPPAGRKIPAVPAATSKPTPVAVPKLVSAPTAKHGANGSISTPKPPVNATSKPKPPPPGVGSKPAPPKVGTKPPVPSAPRPVPAASMGPKKAGLPKAPGGQMDLAAVMARRAQQSGN